MEFFSRKKPDGEPLPFDNVLGDLPRGDDSRPPTDGRLPHTHFERPETLATLGFKDRTADNFLGLINGVTTAYERPDGRREYHTKGGALVGFRDDRHLTTVAGSRSGKGRSAIIPTLLTYGGSILIVDPKGENASITQRFRREVLGQKVFVLDPFEVARGSGDQPRAQFNPLASLTLTSLTIIEDAGLIADALVMPSSKDETHWDESAKMLIEAVILHVATSDKIPDHKRNLVHVAGLLSSRDVSWPQLVAQMLENPRLDNLIVGAARAMQDKSDNERASIVSTARKNLKFIDYDAMTSVLREDHFNLEDLKGGNMTIYLVLPTRYLANCARWLRLFVNLSIGAMERVTVRPKLPTLMVLDEFAVLNRMHELETAIGQMAGMGLRIWTILQDLTQLKALYGDRWETFLGNSGVLQFFGQVDYFTAEWVSKYLDETTITITDQHQTSFDQRMHQGASGLGQRTQTVRLMTPAEVRCAFARDDYLNRQLVLIPGRRPYILQRANYDVHEFFKGRFDPWL